MPKRVDANQPAIVEELRAYTYTITGPPRTKKNHGRVKWGWKRKRVFHVPSEAWERWRDSATIAYPSGQHRTEPIGEPVNCRAIFYRDARRGDAIGYYQGLADLLEHRGIVADDKFIVSWDGSRLEVDRENPRVEVTLEMMEGAKS